MTAKCAVEICDHQATGSKEFCHGHQQRFKRTGVRPTTRLQRHIHGTPVERFWAYVDTTAGVDGCWLWTGGRETAGYGLFNLGEPGRRSIRAHRYSLELASGRPLDAGKYACHRCDNPPCVNPAHLFEGTPGDNARDMVTKGRHNWASAATCRNGHPWTEETTNIRETTRDGVTRTCRACRDDLRESRLAARRAKYAETPEVYRAKSRDWYARSRTS